MFKVVGTTIFFNEWEVATIDPWLRDTVRMDLVYELERHLPTADVAAIIERLAKLDIEINRTREESIKGTW